MKTDKTNLLRILLGLALGLASMTSVAYAQSTASNNKSGNNEASKAKKDKKSPARKSTATPTSDSAGEDAGNFTVTSTLEFGYRGIRVDGDVNKFKSDLNLKAGPRLFDSTFLLKSKNGGKGQALDSLLVTSTGWGADPYGNMRIIAEKPEAYRFEGTYRRFKYYRFLNSIANPNWLFTPIPVPPNPDTGLHGFNTYTQMGDFDLTILPKNETIRFNIGYSPERYSGPAYTNYHNGGNEFWLLSKLKTSSNDFRVGADGRLSPIDWTFLQGFRRFHDESTIDQGIGINRNVASTVAQLSSFHRQEPTEGKVNFTRASLHSLIAKKLDITGRIIYSRSTSNSAYLENFAGTNFNFRITGFPPTPPAAQPNTTNPSFYNIVGDVTRPNTVGDIGITFLATDKFRVSNTFRVEDFTIDGIGTFSAFFSLTRPITGGTRTDTFTVPERAELKTTKYRKYMNTIEGDYQFSPKYSIHFGYRYARRHEEQTTSGFAINANSPAAIVPVFEEEENNTHAVFGGFKLHPIKTWTLYFDAEHGTADNVFTRIGNYDYTNIRAKSRFTPNRKVNFNLAFISKDSANPSEIAGVSLSDFGVDLKSRIFTSSLDWMPNSRITINAGYNYTWVNSDAIIDYFYQVPPAASVRHPNGHALYFQRNNFFYVDVVARLNRVVTWFSSYRINQDDGQGSRVADPAGTPGTLISSYPINFQSPESRLAFRVNRHLDLNLGYQYYAYNESKFLTTFPGSPRAQNYHAHLPYMSLRFYFGRKE